MALLTRQEKVARALIGVINATAEDESDKKDYSLLDEKEKKELLELSEAVINLKEALFK